MTAECASGREAVGPEAKLVTIFVTVYDEYALRAFDVHALDYLLKPLDEERFAEALDHARSRIAEQAAGDYVQLHTAEKMHLVRKTMKKMDVALDPDQFLHIHRSTIINFNFLREMRPYGSNNEYTVVLKEGTRRKLIRHYRDEMADFFDGTP